MGQIVSLAAKPKRCNLNKLSQLETPAAGEHILISSDNSMNAAGQGNFDCYIVGDGSTAATALPLHNIENTSLFSGNVYGQKSQAVNVIKNKYVNKNGVLTSVSGLKTFVLDVSSVKAVILEYTASAANVNYGIIFSNTSDISSVYSYVAPYTTTAGKKIIFVPQGANYLAYSQGVISAVEDSAVELTQKIAELGKTFQKFKMPDITTASFVNGYFRNNGTIYESNSFRTALFPVNAGDIYYLKQKNLGSAYGYYGFSLDDTATKIISFVAANPVELTTIVVPQHAKYLVINFGEGTETTTYPSNIEEFGVPAADSSISVYNYNPNFLLNKKISTDFYMVPWSAQSDKYTLGYDNGVGVYAEYSGESVSNIQIFQLAKRDLRNEFLSGKKIRIKMLLKTDKVFRVRLYTWGSSSSYIEDSKLIFKTNIWYTYDHIFDLTNVNIDSVTFFSVALSFTTSTGSYAIDVSQLIITDEVYDKDTQISCVSSKDENYLARELPYIFKRCLYIGDSVSTANNYNWKKYIEDTYRVQYLRDSSLPPANGGIKVIPTMADESSVATANKSIWYRCANNRMSIYTFDMISLLGGFNDLNNYPSLGTINDKPYVDDASTFATPSDYTDVWTDSLSFAQCYMGCIEMLKRDFPDKEIVLATVYPTSYGTATDANTGLSRSESMAILQCQVANKYGLRCVPLYWMFAQNAIYAMTLDGVHPNPVLARQMASKYAEVLEF